MKIGYVGMDATNYGSASHECKVARVLAELGHEVFLLAERVPNWGEEKLPSGLTCSVAPVNVASQAEEVGASLSDDFDVVFASSASGAPIVESWMKRTGKNGVAQVLDVPMWRLLWRERAPWFEQWRPWFSSLMRMSRVVVNTEQTSQDLQFAAALYEHRNDDGSGKVPPRTVVYYGIDVEAADASVKADVRPIVGRSCVGVSRLLPYKGFYF